MRMMVQRALLLLLLPLTAMRMLPEQRTPSTARLQDDHSNGTPRICHGPGSTFHFGRCLPESVQDLHYMVLH